MAVEMLEKAQRILRSLQSSDNFEHAGFESRGIRVQTASLVENMARLIVVNPDLEDPLIWMAGLIKKVSEDYGTYVRVKGGGSVFINVRGMVGPFGEQPTLEELAKIDQRRSGFHMYIFSDGRSAMSAETNFLELDDGQEIGKIINNKIKGLTEEQKVRMNQGMLDVITQEVAQSGEFLDLD